MDHTGLYLNIEGTLFAVNKVQSDGRGVYVEDKVWDVWYCDPNNHPNPFWRITCAICGAPR